MLQKTVIFPLLASTAFQVYSGVTLDHLVQLDEIQITDLAYGGNACPVGGLKARLSEDKTHLNINFDQFNAHSDQNKHGYIRKTCQFRVALHVPIGLKVQLTETTYQGHIDVHPNGVAGLNASHIFSGKPTGDLIQHTWHDFKHHERKPFTIAQPIAQQDRVSGACGQDVFLQVNTSTFASHPIDGQPTHVQLQPKESPSASYTLEWQSCGTNYAAAALQND